MLQWGHAFSDVETRGMRGTHAGSAARFNGATPFQTWKPGALMLSVFASNRLQWGHAFSDVETRLCAVDT